MRIVRGDAPNGVHRGIGCLRSNQGGTATISRSIYPIPSGNEDSDQLSDALYSACGVSSIWGTSPTSASCTVSDELASSSTCIDPVPESETEGESDMDVD